MDVGSTLRVLVRRWLVLLLGTVLTVGAAAYVYSHSPAQYQATARVLLLLPAEARGEFVGSPFLHLPNGLEVLASMLSLTATTTSSRAEMTALGHTSQYEIGVDENSPALMISVEGSDPQDVIATRDQLIVVIQDELRKVQREEKAPPHQFAATRVYAANPTPDEMGGDPIRAVLAVLAAGGLLTLILVFMTDRLSEMVQVGRAARRRAPGVGATKSQYRRGRPHDSQVGRRLPQS